MSFRIWHLRNIVGHRIGKDCRISWKARLDLTNPKGVEIGDYTGIALGVVVLTHDFVRNRHLTTRIGSRCLIGANAIILPGVTVGDGCVIAPGAVVNADIPDGCIALGNPARVIERNITTAKWGVRIDKLEPDRIDPRVVL
jgi:acetyltransferase-like isoleucine patch superfamily enzyme